MQSTNIMITIAKGMTDDETKASADYFGSIKWTPWIKVIETSAVPKTRIAGGLFLTLDGNDKEPIGERIIEVPVDALPEFLDFFHREVGIEPVWVCPLRPRRPDVRWPLYPLDPATTYVNVGFWSTVAVPSGTSPADGRVNRRIEQVVTRLGGRKSLYSTAFYSREEFASLYGGDAYAALRSTYDGAGRLPDMWTKTVGRG